MALEDLTGRCAVITGASRGIGAGMATDFAKRGMKLGLCSRSAPILGESDDVVSESFDVTDEAALGRFTERVAERFGAIDLWINNAGLLEPIAPLRDVEVGDFRRHIDVNLTGVFLGTRAFVRHRRALGGGGVLLNVSSGAAWSAYSGWATYCAGKAGLERMTESVQLEEADIGLRAHAVAPGVVDTQMQELIRATPEDRFPDVERFHELKRDAAFNSPGFVARKFLEIAFDDSARPEEVAVRIPYEHESGA